MNNDFIDIFAEINFFLVVGVCLGVSWFLTLKLTSKSEKAWLVLRNSIFIWMISLLVVIGEFIKFGSPRYIELLTCLGVFLALIIGFLVEWNTQKRNQKLSKLILSEVSTAIKVRSSWIAFSLFGLFLLFGCLVKI